MAHPPPRILAILTAQHSVLREALDRCEQLADDLDAGFGEPSALTTAVMALRAAFAAHIRFAAARVGQVAFPVSPARVRPGAPTTDLLRQAIGDLRAHLEAEQHYFAASERKRCAPAAG